MEKNISESKRKILNLIFIKERDWQELKNETGLSDPVLAKHIRDLIKLGLITEEINPKDRRKKIYKIRHKELPTAVLVDALSIYILYELSNEIKNLDISGEGGDEIAKRIGKYYALYSLDDRGKEAILKALDYLATGWDYILEKCIDKEHYTRFEKDFPKERKELLDKATKAVIEIYEGYNIYRWILDNPEKFREIAEKKGLGKEATENILKRVGGVSQNYEKVLTVLREKNPFFSSIVLSKLEEKYELTEDKIIKILDKILSESNQ